jgi:hypothetical protein
VAVLALAALLWLAALPARPARAQLYLGWDACHGDSASVSNVVFSCDAAADTVYRLIGTFSLPAEVRDVVTVDAVLDFFYPPDRGIPPFWHFEAAGCNNSGISLSDARPAAGCSGHSRTLCGPGGGACDGLITAYGPGFGGPDRGRLLVALVRRSDSPVDLAGAPARHFAFQVLFAMDRADSSHCEGCALPVAVRWTSATLFTVDEARQQGREGFRVVCDEPGGSPFATIGGAAPASCDSSAVAPR